MPNNPNPILPPRLVPDVQDFFNRRVIDATTMFEMVGVTALGLSDDVVALTVYLKTVPRGAKG